MVLQQLVRKHMSHKLLCLQCALTLQQCCKEVLFGTGGLSSVLTRAVCFLQFPCFNFLSNTIILHVPFGEFFSPDMGFNTCSHFLPVCRFY